jgi:N-methylhydantoinase A
VTDADLLLGYLPVSGFAGGRMTLDVDAATRAVRTHVADPLGIDVQAAAWGIVRTVNATMADAVRRVLATKGLDPRELALLAFGGNGPVHAWAQAAELGIDRVLIPRTAPAFSALGLLVADYVVDLSRAYVTPLAEADPLRLQRLFADLEDEARKDLSPAGLPAERIRVQRYAGLCYPGQNFDMAVPVADDPPEVDRLAAAFHDLHEADRGYAFRRTAPELRQVRVVLTGVTDKPAVASAAGDSSRSVQPREQRSVHFGDGFVAASVYDGAALSPGARIDGPALIEEPFTVVVVAPGQTASLDPGGNYFIQLGT